MRDRIKRLLESRFRISMQLYLGIGGAVVLTVAASLVGWFSFNRVGEVLEMSDEDLLRIRNFGEKSLVELQEKLAENGITSPRQGSGEQREPVAIGALSTDDLSDLMGTEEDRDGDSDVLPVGMTYEDDSLLASGDGSNGEDADYEEYE